MFRPKKMRKVRLIVLKTHLGGLIRDLHEAGIVDIRKARYEDLDEGRALPSFDQLSGELLKLRTVLTLMESSLGKADLGEPEIMDGERALEEARGLEFVSKLRELNSEAARINERQKALENEALIVEKVLHFRNVDFSGLKTKNIDYRLGEIPASRAGRLSERIEKMKGHTTLICEPGFDACLVIFERKAAPDIDSTLGELGFSDIELPEGMSTPMDAINRINAESDSSNARLADIRKEMASISLANVKSVWGLIRSLEIEAQRAEIAERFSSSKCAHVIEGWMLGEDESKLRGVLGKYPDAIEEEANVPHGETPPTVLDNPQVASPFEFLTSNYTLPNYFELDPTLAYFIFLPIMYGMIVGDVVYGLISLVLAFTILKKFEKSYMMSNVAKIWLYSAIPTIIFGVLFDEWGGMSHLHLSEVIGTWTGIELLHAPLYSGFHRIENVLALIGITALVGMLHLAAGFVFGAINEWNHNKKHAIAKIAWIGVEGAILLILLPSVGFAPQAFSTAGLVLLAVSVVILALTEGIIGIIELPGLVGNILSYSRIAVIGIVGVILAEILNEFLMPLPEQGIMAFVLIPIFIALHVANCFIAMFESLIQGGRLNIVEFKMKFMHGGGGVFTPFALYSKKF